MANMLSAKSANQRLDGIDEVRDISIDRLGEKYYH
jgi:hypothetical protein